MDHLAGYPKGKFVNLQNHFDSISGLEREARVDAASGEAEVRDSAFFRCPIPQHPDIGITSTNIARKNRDGGAGGLRGSTGVINGVWSG
jgi:hypothetical protein